MLDNSKNDPIPVAKNINWKTDLAYAMQLIRWLLVSMGVWPLSYQSNGVEKFIAAFLAILCSFLLVFVIVPSTLYISMIEKNPDIKIKVFGPLSCAIMAFVEYVELLNGRNGIAKCINHVTNDWQGIENSDDRKVMLAHARFGRYGSIICAVFMYSGGIFFVCVLPIIRGSVIIDELNITIRPLTFASYYVFFNPQIDPTYKIVFWTQWAAGWVIHSVVIACNSLAVVFIMHACGQLEILVLWLNNLVDNDDKETKNFDTKIARVIDHHVRVLRFVYCLDDVLSTIFFAEIVGCTFGLCLLGYLFLSEWEQSDAIAITTYSILITSYTFNIFINCYIGDLLTEECKKVGETSYMIDWYRLPSKKAIGLVLTIATAHRPATITAGKMVDLSLVTFCTVIRTSLTYLNMLRTFVM